MEIKKISWVEGNFDLNYDDEPVLVEQEWGSKGIGGIVFVLCALAVLLPVVPIVMQIVNGTAKGNPVGGLIALFVIFSWPLYWGFSQFFLKRRFVIGNDVAKFELISLLGTKKYEVKIADYGQISFGKSASRRRTDSAPGITGTYFVHLPHEDRKRKIVLYEHVQKLMSEERLQRYSEKWNLPLVDVTPERTGQDDKLKSKMEAMLKERNQLLEKK